MNVIYFTFESRNTEKDELFEPTKQSLGDS